MLPLPPERHVEDFASDDSIAEIREPLARRSLVRRLVREAGKPIAQVARELGVNEGTLGNWCAQERRRHGEGTLSASEREELRRLRRENAELRMRCDVLKRSAALWVEDAMRR
jgi:transposase